MARSLFLRLPPRGQRLPPAAPVERFDGALEAAIDRMLDLLARTGYPALSGPLVGYARRVIVIDLTGSGRSQVVLINPTLERVSTERQRDREGCLAIPGLLAHVDRPLWIVTAGLTRTGQTVHLHLGGLLARIVQHELDHLDGLSLLDRLDARERLRAEAWLSRRPPVCPRSAGQPADEPRRPSRPTHSSTLGTA